LEILYTFSVAVMLMCIAFSLHIKKDNQHVIVLKYMYVPGQGLAYNPANGYSSRWNQPTCDMCQCIKSINKRSYIKGSSVNMCSRHQALLAGIMTSALMLQKSLIKLFCILQIYNTI